MRKYIPCRQAQTLLDLTQGPALHRLKPVKREIEWKLFQKQVSFGQCLKIINNLHQYQNNEKLQLE